MGIFRHESAGSDGVRALRLRWISLRERGSIDAEAFLTDGALDGENGIAGVYGRPQSGFRFYDGGARGLHEPSDFPVSAISLQTRCAADSNGHFLQRQR
jgi:hypothetical protein